MVSEVVASQREVLAELCRHYGVRRLDLFGSAAVGEDDPDRSDLDFAVEFGPCVPAEHYERYFGLLESLEGLFSRPVDLVERNAVRNPYFLQQLERTRSVVYAA